MIVRNDQDDQAKIYIFKTTKHAFSPPAYVSTTAYSYDEAAKHIIAEYRPDYIALTKTQNIDLYTFDQLDRALNI